VRCAAEVQRGMVDREARKLRRDDHYSSIDRG